MRIATAGSITSKRWRTAEMSWDAFLARLRTPLRTGESFAEYQRMTKDERSKKKEAAGAFVGGAMEGGRRVAGAVTERWLITLDADEARRDDWENAVMLYEGAVAVYSTHSHTPEKPRLRWVIPLTRGVSREEYQAIARLLAADLGIIETLDTTTYQPERGMFWPTCAQDGEYVFRVQDGPFLDPDAALRRYGQGDAWRDTTAWPIASREKEVVLREARKQADPEGKGGIVGAFCRTYDVPSAIDAFLPDVYEEAGSGRYTYTGGSTYAGAVLYENGAFLYSNHATDPAGGQLCNAYDLVRLHRFGELDEGHENQQDTARLPSYKAMREWAASLPEISRAQAEEAVERARADFEDMADICAGSTSARGGTEGEVTEDEKDRLKWAENLTRDPKTGAIMPTVDNLLLIMENDPHLAGAMARNDFKANPVRRGELPWRRGAEVEDEYNGDNWADEDDSGLRWYIEKYWGIEAAKKVLDAWNLVLSRHAFHPVREYLAGLVWDGKERADTLFIRYMKAQDSEYVRAVTRKWLCAAVARVYNPGCKFDQMLVLVGPQGQGKSTLAYTLSKGWFTDSLNGMGNKEAFEALRGKWIIELAELSATKRSEEETVKNYITKRVDTYRPAYGRHVVDFPRQCVFYGTTNDYNIIKDRTGGRRYWPIEVTGFDRGRLRGLAEEVDQIWAEVMVRWKDGEALWIDDDDLHEAELEAQACFTLEDDMTGLILEYLDKPLPDTWADMDINARREYIQGGSTAELGSCTLRRDMVSVVEIRMELMGENRETIGRNDAESRRISGVLNHLRGWVRTGKTMRRGPYGPQRVYVRAGVEVDIIQEPRETDPSLKRLQDTVERLKAQKDGADVLD